MRLAICRFSFAVAALAVVFAFDISAASGQVSCNDVVSAKVAMTTDLVCGMNPGFTVNGGGAVDMAGYQLTACAGCTGVALLGQAAQLSNGSIVGSGAGSIGVSLGGSGKHQVANVTVTGAETGFGGTSGSNKLKNNTAYGANTGFSLTGDKNALGRNHSSGSTFANFIVTGDGNNLTENTSAATTGAASGGIYVSGNANKLNRNVSSGDQASGSALAVGGNENKLNLNTVSGSTGLGGLLVFGNENKLLKNVAVDNAGVGIGISGNLNKLTSNAAYDNQLSGIDVGGNGNSINASNSSNNVQSGINVPLGDANSFKSNVVMHNTLHGVFLFSGVTNSSISKTVALENTDDDLRDDNANCGSNVWAMSVFRTSEVAGFPSLGCIQ